MAAPIPGTPSTQGDTGTNTPTTKAHTTAAGETYMLVKIGMQGVSLGTVASVAFGATSLALLKAEGGGSNVRGELWGGTVPASTADTVTVTYATSNCNATVAIVSFSGVDSVGTPKSSVETSGTTSSLTFDESGAETLATDFLMTHFGDATPTPGGTVEYASFQDGGNQTKQAGSHGVAASLAWSGLDHGNRDSVQIGITLTGTGGGGGFLAGFAAAGANQGMGAL